jgi:hypothetical protein
MVIKDRSTTIFIGRVTTYRVYRGYCYLSVAFVAVGYWLVVNSCWLLIERH